MESDIEIIQSEEIVANDIKYFYETLSNGEKRLRHYDEKYKIWVILKTANEGVLSQKEMEKVLTPLLKSMYYDYLKRNYPEIYKSFHMDKYHY